MLTTPNFLDRDQFRSFNPSLELVQFRSPIQKWFLVQFQFRSRSKIFSKSYKSFQSQNCMQVAMVNVKGSPVHIRPNYISSLVLFCQISKNESVTLHFHLILPNILDIIQRRCLEFQWKGVKFSWWGFQVYQNNFN